MDCGWIKGLNIFSSVALVYAIRNILRCDSNWRSAVKPTQERKLRRYCSPGLSLMTDGAAPKCPRTLGGIMGGTGTLTKEVKVKGEDRVIDVNDVTDPAASP